MTPSLDVFRASLTHYEPPLDLPKPLAALWWAYRSDWDRAHALVQDHDGADAAWVHAHLHRVEGDTDNAAYWYAHAGRPPADGSLEVERAGIARALLADR